MISSTPLASWLLASVLTTVANSPPCPDLSFSNLPPGLGGVAPSGVGLEQAYQWQSYRRAREQERFLEALEPAAVLAKYRAVSQSMIANECVPTPVLIDLGRALFLRNFTPSEGLGNDLSDRHASAGLSARPNRRRLGAGTFGGPEALSCKDCHWRGGMAGAGDRADNVFMGGAGDTVDGQEQLMAPSLWGAGWIELLAREMSEDLIAQRDRAIDAVRANGRAVTIDLSTKGIPFGSIQVRPSLDHLQSQPRVDYRGIDGISSDLIVRPFGWRGRYQSIRESVVGQSHLHLGLQAEELSESRVESRPLPWLDLGLNHSTDPDNDGVEKELTLGQISALSSYLATLRPPRTIIPTNGPDIGESMTAELQLSPSSELIHRWGAGARQFQALGCADCHRPYLELEDSIWSTGPSKAEGFAFDLAEFVEPSFRARRQGKLAVPVFSDFRRHAMGEYLEQIDAVTGEVSDEYLTRPLWGLASTAPWMHDGRATTLDEAILLHGGPGSEALSSAQAYEALGESERTAIRVYLMSLQRPASIRIR